MALRMEIKLRPISRVTVPFNYQHHLMGLFYKFLSMSDEKLAKDLHSLESPKPFCFSWIRGKPIKATKDGIIYDESSILRITFSSWEDDLIDHLSFSMINTEKIKIASAVFEIEEMRAFQRNIKSREKMIALSPIVISRGVRKNDKIYHEFLSPRDEEFFKRLRENALKKCKIYTRCGEELSIKPDVKYIEFKRTSKLVDIKGTKIRGHIFPFEIEGDLQLVKFIYYSGIGERTSQGFGCIEAK